MSIPYLDNLDLNKNQLLNAVMQLLAAAPNSPVEGLFYYNSAEHKAYQYKGASLGWRPMGDENVIEAIMVNGTAQSIVDKTVDISVPVASDATPAMDGAGAAGSGTAFARADHVHPHDTDKLDKAGGTMSGAIAMGSNKITGLGNGTADGDAVNLSQMLTAIRENAGIFRGTYATKAALDAVAWQTSDPSASYYVTNNDFAIVTADETHSNETWRYVYVAGTGSGTGWQAQYRINETPFTQAQLDAINSGITAALVAKIGTSETAITQTRTMIAGTESSTTASQAYAEGDYFIYNNILYLATAAIAFGGTITPNTNCTAVDLTSELNRKAVKVATGTIGTSAISASVAYTGTVVNAYATQGGSQVLVDVAIGSSAVTFSVSAAPSSAVTCTVVYI